MLILLAAYKKKKKKKKKNVFLSDTKYDVKTFLLIMSRKCVSS